MGNSNDSKGIYELKFIKKGSGEIVQLFECSC
jgi:hypothetical protein